MGYLRTLCMFLVHNFLPNTLFNFSSQTKGLRRASDHLFFVGEIGLCRLETVHTIQGVGHWLWLFRKFRKNQYKPKSCHPLLQLNPHGRNWVLTSLFQHYPNLLEPPYILAFSDCFKRWWWNVSTNQMIDYIICCNNELRDFLSCLIWPAGLHQIDDVIYFNEITKKQLFSIIFYNNIATIIFLLWNNEVAGVESLCTSPQSIISHYKFGDRTWEYIYIYIYIYTGTESGFEPEGGQSMNQKNFKWHDLLKKKIMVAKTIAFYYHIYLSQKGNNMNQKSWKLRYDILTFSKKKNKKRRGLQISRFWVIGIKMLILSRWPTHQYNKSILLDATKNHTNEVFKTLLDDFKKLGY